MKRQMRRFVRIAVSLLAVSQFTGRELIGQGSSARTPTWQAQCDMIAGRVAAKSIDLPSAKGEMVNCDEETARLIPEHWRAVVADSAYLNALIWLSVHVRDKRLYTEVRAVALSSGQPNAVRGAALAVLASYINSSMTGSVRHNTRTGALISTVGYQDHASQTDGSQTLGSTEYTEIFRVLTQLSSRDPSQEIREIANYILVATKLDCKDRARNRNVHACPN